MNTEIFDLGKIGITLGGEYDNKVIYEKLTIILYKGKSYISTKTIQGLSPEQDIRSWQLVAEAKDAYHMLIDAGKITLSEEEFLEQLVDASKGRFIVQGNITNAADEEDLTIEHSDLLGIDTLKLANRDNTNGMGYVILRKNKSFAEQVTKENTIYEIRYEFNFNGNEINIPNNCVLKFNGGSISNGTLNGSETLIDNVDSLTSVFNSITLKGTFSNKQNSFKWWGAIANDSTKELHNGALFTYLLNNHPTIEIDDDYYINFSEVTISNKITLYGNGSIILSKGTIIPAEGFSIIIDNISFTKFKGLGFIDADNLSILIDKISLRNCNIKGENGGTRFIYITFADLDLSHTIGIRTFEFVNNNVNNEFVTCCINDCQFVDSVTVKGNTFINFKEAPIYFASTNEKTYANKRCQLSAPIQICNNSFVCKDVCIKADYHCSCVIESNTVYFNGNYIEGIASIVGNDAKSDTAYDAYLSVKTLYYTNNTIKNVMGWRNDGNEKAPDVLPLTEIFKSKGTGTSEKSIRIIKNNYFEIEKSWLDYNKVPDNCNSINLFCFTSTIDTVLFENNVINIPGTILAASNLLGTGKHVLHYYVNNNTIICKEMKGALCSVNNGNTNIADISIECCRNRIKVSTGYITLVRITSSKDNTPVNSIICKNNECNAFVLVEGPYGGIVKNLIFEHTFPNGCINDIATIIVPNGDYKKYKLIFDEVWNRDWGWYGVRKMINNWSFAKKPTNTITCPDIINDSTNTHLNCFIKYIKNGVIVTHGISVDYVEGAYSYTVDGVTKSVGASWNKYITLLSTDGLDLAINGSRNFHFISNDKSWDNGTYYDLNFSVS